MIEHSKLKSLITRITHVSKKRSLKSDIMHPQREWAIGLGVTFVFLVCVIVVSFYFYSIASTTPELTSEQVDTVVPYRATVIGAALEEYRDRELQYQNVSQSLVIPTPEASFDTATSSEVGEDTEVIDNQNQAVDGVEVNVVENLENPDSENSIGSSEALPALDIPGLIN